MTPAKSDSIEEPVILTARPYFRRVGICGTVFFSVMGIAFTFAMALDLDGSAERPMASAIFCGVIWGAFSLLGIYLWAFSKMYRLEILEDSIAQSCVFSGRKFNWSEIEKAKWRNWPQGGSIKLESPSSTMSIELGTSDSREQLIKCLRAKIPRRSQAGWDSFQQFNEKMRSKKTISLRWFAWTFYVFAISFVLCWVYGFGASYLAIAAINVGFAMYLQVQDRKKKQPDRQSRQVKTH